MKERSRNTCGVFHAGAASHLSAASVSAASRYEGSAPSRASDRPAGTSMSLVLPRWMSTNGL